MWALSMNSVSGRSTTALPMLAPPWGIVSVAFSAGWALRWVLPENFSESFGLKPSSPQSVAWKGLEGEALWPLEEVRVLVTAIALQLVGLIVKSGRLTSTLTSR